AVSRGPVWVLSKCSPYAPLILRLRRSFAEDFARVRSKSRRYSHCIAPVRLFAPRIGERPLATGKCLAPGSALSAQNQARRIRLCDQPSIFVRDLALRVANLR